MERMKIGKVNETQKNGLKKSSAKGFTLIELLVVIAIIAILAAILFPVFARARENARRASCSSNFKQIGIGVMMYVQDHDELYPAAWQPYGASPITQQSEWYWIDIIYPYVKSKQVFICPSSDSSQLLGRNYGANSLMLQLYGNPPFNLAALSAASSTYMAMDSGTYHINPDKVSPARTWEWLPGNGLLDASHCSAVTNPDYNKDCMTGRHFDGVTVAFADGHVKWLKVSKIHEQTLRYKAGQSSDWSPTNPQTS